jgi:lipopolysaccharide export system permease protein
MLITRYLIKNLLLVTVFIVFTLTAVIWLTQSLKLLELVANSDAPPGLFLKLVFLSLPKFLEIILPVALVTAVLFTYNRMIADNEIVVMRACGVDQVALAKPALLIAAALTVFLLTLTVYVSPKSATALVALRQQVKAQYSAFLLRDGVFNTFGDDLTVYLRKRDRAGDLYGLMIHDTREKDKPPVTVTAKKGRIVMSDNIPTIVVFDGMRQQMDLNSGAVTKLYFSKYTIEIKNLETDAATRWHEAGERTLGELFNPDMGDPRDRSKAVLFAAEIHNRLVTPFNALSFTLIALCPLLLGPFSRRGDGRKIALAAALAAGAQALNLALVSLMKKNAGFAPALYVATFAPIAAGLWLLHLPGEKALMSFLRKWRARQLRRIAA